jgi:hypothetical protein
MSWIEAALSAASALAGGFVGGWVVAFRLGRWRQRVEDRLESIEDRLADGGRHVDAVPVIEARLGVVLEELRALRKEMREDRATFVGRRECRARHGDGPRSPAHGPGQ